MSNSFIAVLIFSIVIVSMMYLFIPRDAAEDGWVEFHRVASIGEDQKFRMECLKLAAQEDAIDAAPVVDRARAYADFVLGQDGELAARAQRQSASDAFWADLEASLAKKGGVSA